MRQTCAGRVREITLVALSSYEENADLGRRLGIGKIGRIDLCADGRRRRILALPFLAHAMLPLYARSRVRLATLLAVLLLAGPASAQTGGTVVGWGRNAEGQTTPPSGLSGVVDVAAGYYHSLALRSDGTVVAWGHNNRGQAALPSGLSDVVDVAAGSRHSLALKSDGTVVGWGDNFYGETTIPSGLSWRRRRRRSELYQPRIKIERDRRWVGAQ